MRKPDSLRDWLLASVAALAKQPQKLHLYVEEGAINARAGASLSYEYAYDLIVIVEDYADPSDHLFVPLLAWLSKHQPDALDADSPGIAVATDILDNQTADHEIRLKLSERAIVTATPEGGWAVTYPDLPLIDPCFAAPAEGARLWQLFLNGSLALAHPDHVPAGLDPLDVVAPLPVPSSPPQPIFQPTHGGAFPSVPSDYFDPGDLTLLFNNRLI